MMIVFVTHTNTKRQEYALLYRRTAQTIYHNSQHATEKTTLLGIATRVIHGQILIYMQSLYNRKYDEPRTDV